MKFHVSTDKIQAEFTLTERGYQITKTQSSDESLSKIAVKNIVKLEIIRFSVHNKIGVYHVFSTVIRPRTTQRKFCI